MKDMAEHLFPYRWNLADGYPAKGIKPNGCKVFGTFICGGGSTMGYKLSGFEHLGGVEIDPKIADVYRENHKPKHLFVEDIRLFNKRTDLPAELFDLDLLDGSPPCSTFSMAGSREKAWGKKKQFREGQAVQVLDDLVFEYVRTIDKLKPKVCLLENVRGIIQGNAKVYSKEIVRQMTAAGYRVQVFLLNAASMGVPQRRERVFFVGLRKDFDLPELRLRFDENPILFKDVKEVGIKQGINGQRGDMWDKCRQGKSFSTISNGGNFSSMRLSDGEVCGTITANQCEGFFHSTEKRKITHTECKRIGSYPQDFNFNGVRPMYLIGMSVPPVMTAQIANQIWVQWLSKIKTKTK
jgi:DNA (cytosine-5)-methyltransferase 1